MKHNQMTLKGNQVYFLGTMQHTGVDLYYLSIKSLKNTKSVGQDDLSTVVLKVANKHVIGVWQFFLAEWIYLMIYTWNLFMQL